MSIKQKYGPFSVELAKLGDDDMCVSNVNFFEKQVHYTIRWIHWPYWWYYYSIWPETVCQAQYGRSEVWELFVKRPEKITTHGDNTCVVDYVWDRVKG